jgi:hypothetical protein
MSRVIALLTLALACGGCARMVVTKDPKPHDKGIRFYRPKPYLFIGPAGGAVSSSSDKGGGNKGDVPPQEALPAPPAEETQATSYTEGADGKTKLAMTDPPVLATVPVTMHIEYLPDYSEEYSIRVTPGLGQAELNVQLQNGWNLNSVDAKTDQKYAEIIGSVASLVGAVGKAGLKDEGPFSHAQAESNVPLGYYEAVIAVNECGRKEMLGWRYVGFMPCFTCPVKACVHRDQVTCDDESMYALVFERGTLRMKKMAEMKGPGEANLNCANCPHCHAATATDEDGSGGFNIEGQGGRVRQ